MMRGSLLIATFFFGLGAAVAGFYVLAANNPPMQGWGGLAIVGALLARWSWGALTAEPQLKTHFDDQGQPRPVFVFPKTWDVEGVVLLCILLGLVGLFVLSIVLWGSPF